MHQTIEVHSPKDTHLHRLRPIESRRKSKAWTIGAGSSSHVQPTRFVVTCIRHLNVVGREGRRRVLWYLQSEDEGVDDGDEDKGVALQTISANLASKCGMHWLERVDMISTILSMTCPSILPSFSIHLPVRTCEWDSFSFSLHLWVCQSRVSPSLTVDILSLWSGGGLTSSKSQCSTPFTKGDHDPREREMRYFDSSDGVEDFSGFEINPNFTLKNWLNLTPSGVGVWTTRTLANGTAEVINRLKQLVF